jgi:hypothetical protein
VYLGHQLVDSLRGKRAPATLCTAQLNLMHALLVRGSIDEAWSLSRATLQLALDHGLVWQAVDLLAWLAACQGDLQAAARMAGWSDASYRRRDEPRTPAREHAREEVRRRLSALPATLLEPLGKSGEQLDASSAMVLWDGIERST